MQTELLLLTLQKIQSDISSMKEDTKIEMKEMKSDIQALMKWRWSVYGAATAISIISGGVMSLAVSWILK